jgi:hypothetical protein
VGQQELQARKCSARVLQQQVMQPHVCRQRWGIASHEVSVWVMMLAAAAGHCSALTTAATGIAP